MYNLSTGRSGRRQFWEERFVDEGAVDPEFANEQEAYDYYEEALYNDDEAIYSDPEAYLADQDEDNPEFESVAQLDTRAAM
ncbi:uncharacterized protein N7496_009889 [Penicillium cataractarum]|uniref:Uncharacterized protein n=1 Tax=Penicillium cataractarum TaxID=2100454 RepID=A0A9W9RQA7_9EURO|nr:uncharacterized protein N7496_009889 [Penicillium cataractarum]KAJ5364176.1 hypothetical protein N7496_009889 [Penicillium cataractarum]